MGRRMKESGFTLVEVLASLLIFSIAIIGLTRAGTQSVAHAARLADKTHASIVANNVLIRARMEPADIGSRSGSETAGGRAYDWTLVTTETDVSDLVQLSVTIRTDRTGDFLIARDTLYGARR